MRDECEMVKFANMPSRAILTSQAVARHVDAGGKPFELDAAVLQSKHDAQLPHGLLGRDRFNRIVMYKNYGALNMWELDQIGIDYDTLVQYNKWLTERLAYAMGHRGHWTVIIDLANMGLQQCSSPTHLLYCKEISLLDSLHYPERLGQVIIINAPGVFSFAFHQIKAWLPESTQKKVMMCGGPNDWRPVLEEIMDLDILPIHLGGKTLLSLKGLEPTEPSTPHAWKFHHRQQSGMQHGCKCQWVAALMLAIGTTLLFSTAVITYP